MKPGLLVIQRRSPLLLEAIAREYTVFDYGRADDPDGDPDDNYIDPGDPYGRTCAERHNQIYTVEDAQNIDDHPNGTLNWQPMPRNYKPEETLV